MNKFLDSVLLYVITLTLGAVFLLFVIQMWSYETKKRKSELKYIKTNTIIKCQNLIGN